jgi:hypothetical protein
VSDWTTARADEVQPGDRIRLYGQELAVTRVDAPFLGRENMVLFVESTDERWHCLPAGTDTEVELQR